MKPGFAIFSDNLDYALGWMVVHSLWQATVIAIISGILMIALRKKSAQLRYIITNISLWTVLLSAVVTFCFYYDFSTKAPEILTNQSLDFVQSETPSTPITMITEGGQNVTDNSNTVVNLTKFKDYFNQHLPLVLTIWILGVSLFLLRLLGSVSYIYYLKSRMNFPADEYWTEMVDNLSKKAGLNKMVDLVESAMVRSPVVVGHLKPIILFPIGVINRLEPQEVEAILAHELAHVLRHDYLFNILQSIIEALFYYHPAVWWLSTQIRNERESACDDIAINLINNKMNYAKALVTIQEMAFFPLNAALGFAGQHKNQFMLRMQRILNMPHNKTNVMEKLIATLLIACTLLGLAYANKNDFNQNHLENLSKQDDSFIQINSDAPLSMTGLWQGTIENNEVCIVFNNNLKGGNWSSTECFDKNAFSELPTEEKEFTLTRPAGTMTLKGKFEGKEGYGKFNFTENKDFRTYLESQGMSNIKEATLLHCFFANIDKDFLVYLKQKGYNELTNKQLEELAIFRIDKKVMSNYLDLLAKSGNSQPPLKKIVELKIHGVDNEYIQTLQKFGYMDVPIEQVLEAKIHGIDEEYMQSFINNKVDNRYSLKKLIEMKIHGADGQFVSQLEAKSGKKLDANDIVEAKIFNLDKVDTKRIEAAGTKLSGDDIKTFAIHGIDADYIEKVNNMGFGKLSSDQIVTMKIHGITPEYLKEYASLGFKSMDFDDIVTAKIHGINANEVKRFNELGFQNFSFDNVVTAKIHGITPEYLQNMKNSGFKNITFDDIVGYKIHGVTPEYVKEFNEAGFKNISNDEIMSCKIHGVTPQYIKGFESVGLKNLDIDDAIAFKIHGVTPEFVKSLKDKGYEIDKDEVLERKIKGRGN